jgi:hypothetical protein
LDLHNDGAATAKDMLVLVGLAAPGWRLVERHVGEWELMVRGTCEWEFAARRPLHPGRGVPLFALTWDADVDWVAADPEGTSRRPAPRGPAPRFHLTVYCENQDRQVLRIEFETQKMIENRVLIVESTPDE